MLIASELYENREFFSIDPPVVSGVGKGWKTWGEGAGIRNSGLGIRVFPVLVYILE